MAASTSDTKQWVALPTSAGVWVFLLVVTVGKEAIFGFWYCKASFTNGVKLGQSDANVEQGPAAGPFRALPDVPRAKQAQRRRKEQV